MISAVLRWIAHLFSDENAPCPPNCMKCGLCAKCDADLYDNNGCAHEYAYEAEYKHIGHEPSWWKSFIARLRAWKT